MKITRMLALAAGTLIAVASASAYGETDPAEPVCESPAARGGEVTSDLLRVGETLYSFTSRMEDFRSEYPSFLEDKNINERDAAGWITASVETIVLHARHSRRLLSLIEKRISTGDALTHTAGTQAHNSSHTLFFPSFDTFGRSVLKIHTEVVHYGFHFIEKELERVAATLREPCEIRIGERERKTVRDLISDLDDFFVLIGEVKRMVESGTLPAADSR